MGNGKIQSQRLRQSEKRSAKLYGNLQSMIQNTGATPAGKDFVEYFAF